MASAPTANSSTGQAETQQESALLGLPPELRNRIYRYALVQETPVTIGASFVLRLEAKNRKGILSEKARVLKEMGETLSRLAVIVQPELDVRKESQDENAARRLRSYKKYRLHHPILRTCRQIYQEALQMYYAENSFFLPREVLQRPRDIHQPTIVRQLRLVSKRHKITFTSIIFEHLTYGGDLALIHLQQSPEGLAINWKFNPGYEPPVVPEALRLDDGRWRPVCPHSLALMGTGLETVLKFLDRYLRGWKVSRRRGKSVVACHECGCGRVFD